MRDSVFDPDIDMGLLTGFPSLTHLEVGFHFRDRALTEDEMTKRLQHYQFPGFLSGENRWDRDRRDTMVLNSGRQRVLIWINAW